MRNTYNCFKGLIKEKEAMGWSFKFIGSDLTKQQVYLAAQTIGIAAINTISHLKSKKGFAEMQDFYASNTTEYRANT